MCCNFCKWSTKLRVGLGTMDTTPRPTFVQKTISSWFSGKPEQNSENRPHHISLNVIIHQDRSSGRLRSCPDGCSVIYSPSVFLSIEVINVIFIVGLFSTVYSPGLLNVWLKNGLTLETDLCNINTKERVCLIYIYIKYKKV